MEVSPSFGTYRTEPKSHRLSGHKSDTQLHGTAFSHDGRRIATVSLDGSARIWDGKSGVLLDVLGQEAPNLKLADIGFG